MLVLNLMYIDETAETGETGETGGREIIYKKRREIFLFKKDWIEKQYILAGFIIGICFENG